MASNKMQEALKQAWAIHNAQVDEQLKVVTEEAKTKRKQPDPPLPVDYLVRKAMKPAFFEWLEIRFDAATQQEEKEQLLKRCEDVKEYIQTNVQVDQQTSKHFQGFRQWLLDQIEYLSEQISLGTMPVLKKGNNDDDTFKENSAKIQAQQPIAQAPKQGGGNKQRNQTAPTVSSQSSQSGGTNSPAAAKKTNKKQDEQTKKQSGEANSNGSSSPNGTPTKSPRVLAKELRQLETDLKDSKLKQAELEFPRYCEIIKQACLTWKIERFDNELNIIKKLLPKCKKGSSEEAMLKKKEETIKQAQKDAQKKEAQAAAKNPGSPAQGNKRTPPKRT